MNIPLLDLKAQYISIKNEIQNSINSVLESSKFIMGKNVDEFEREIAKFIGTKYAISCGNGTDALVLSLEALGIKADDEVITTPYTFFATAESISKVGATPVFVDIDKDTYNINPDLIEEKITSKTKAIIPVHIFGQPADMDKIMEISKKYNLYVIEDACQAIGAEYKGKKCGSIGNIGCFSFFPSKNLGAYGDGGIITTNNEKLAKILSALRVHGSGRNGEEVYNILNNTEETVISDFYDSETKYNSIYNPAKYYNYLIGHNSRLDEIQASILRVKLKYLNNWNQKRKELAFEYNDRLREVPIITPKVLKNVDAIYHLYILQTDKRKELTNYLSKNGISTGIYYPIPLHLQKVYEKLGYKLGSLPVAEYLSHRTFAIPLYPELSKQQQDYIINTIKNFFEE